MLSVFQFISRFRFNLHHYTHPPIYCMIKGCMNYLVYLCFVYELFSLLMFCV